MCGIFGVIATNNNKYDIKTLQRVLRKVASLSESRGKDSSGICFKNEQSESFSVLKSTEAITGLLDSIEFQNILNENLNLFKENQSKNFISFGHSRLVTNGSQLSDENNQPVVKDDIVAIHNGIIVNVDELWNNYPQIQREYEIDTEVLLSLFRHNLTLGQNSIVALQNALNEIKGTVTTAIFPTDRNEAVFSTNNGSF